jgi:hypothetical protein
VGNCPKFEGENLSETFFRLKWSFVKSIPELSVEGWDRVSTVADGSTRMSWPKCSRRILTQKQKVSDFFRGAWSLIRNDKPIVIVERNYQATEK